VDAVEAGTLVELPKEKPGCWTPRRTFAQVRRDSNIQLLPYSLVPVGVPTLADPTAGGSWGEDRQIRAQLPGCYLPSLRAEQLTTRADLELNSGFTATGEVRLVGAHIGGQLSLRGVTLTNPGRIALRLQEARATTLFLEPKDRPDGGVDLTAARVGSFLDEQQTWPASLWLRRFVYDMLENDQVSVRDRLGWLRRQQGGYTPQPYEQLAAAYRSDGRAEAARRVLVAKQWRRRRWFNPWNWLLYATVGDGYRSWLALVWLLIVLWVGTRALDQAQQVGLVAPGKDTPASSPPSTR
jgi:hypothetical protein